jgi:hypothetical protein
MSPRAAALLLLPLLLCAGLFLSGFWWGGVLLLVWCLLLLAGVFLFHFALQSRGHLTMTALFQRGSANGTEDRTASQASPASQAWNRWRQEALVWLESPHDQRSVTSRDGLTLYGDFFPQTGHHCAILLHGYAGKPANLAGTARKFYEMGFSVLLPSARGHGKSGGHYYGMGWLDRLDLLTWVQDAANRDPQAEILLFGVSMGGSAVMMASGEVLPPQVKCIISDCGYSDLWSEFSLQLRHTFHLPAFPLLYMADLICQLRCGFSFRQASAVEQLKKAAVPMLFLHGEQDTFVPYSMLDKVYNACGSQEKEKCSIPGGTHAQAVSADPELYWNAVTDFLREHTDFEL